MIIKVVPFPVLRHIFSYSSGLISQQQTEAGVQEEEKRNEKRDGD